MKKILLYLIALLTPFIFISTVSATSIPVPYNRWQVYASGTPIRTTGFTTLNNITNMSLYVNSYDFEGEFVEVFAKVSICADEKFTSATPGSQVQGVRFESTSIRCSYTGSSYTGGRVTNFYLTLGDIGVIDGYYYWNTTLANTGVSIQVLEVQFADTEFQSNIADDTIINQNDTIINQNETIIQGQQETNDKLQDSINKQDEIKQEQEKTNEELDKLNDNLTNSDAPDNMDGLANSAGWLPPGPIDSILNLPLSMLTNISDNLNKSCQPVNLPLPFVNKDLPLPCLSSIYSQIDGLGPWITTISVIASAFILFSYLLKLYKWVDDTLTFRENNEIDNWGGL